MTWYFKTNIKGPKGENGGQGPQGLPGTGAVPADTAVAAYISTTGTSSTRTAFEAKQSREGVTTDNSPFRKGNNLYAFGDSFLAQDVANDAGQRYIDQLTAKWGKTLTNRAVSGSWMQDAANAAIGTAGRVGPGLASTDIVLIAAGINDAVRTANDAAAIQRYKWNLESLIWAALASARIEHTAWTPNGTWSVYTGANADKMSSGSSLVTSAAGSYAETTFTGPKAYVAIAPLLTNATQVSTGRWLVDGVEVFPEAHDLMQQTSNGSILGYRPIKMTRIGSGTHTIRVQATAANYNVFLDALYEVSNTPPTIVVVKPTYVIGPSYTVPDGVVDLYRKAVDDVINIVRAADDILGHGAARIVAVDPGAGGFTPYTLPLTGGDGLHLNNTGHAFMRDLVERTVQTATGQSRGAVDTTITDLLTDPNSAAYRAVQALIAAAN